MTDDTTDTTTDDAQLDDQQATDAAALTASSTYKVLGEFAATDGAGVLGKNTASSGTPIGVEGAVPNSSSGYGLSTPGDARVGGTAELNALAGALTGNQTITDLLGDGLAVSSGALSADPARPDLDDGSTTVTDADALTLGSGLTLTDDGDGTVTVKLDVQRTRSWWVEGAKQVASTESTDTEFGFAVALSDDGTTALVGEPNSASNVKGRANAFVRSGGTWSSASRFTGNSTSNELNDRFGYEVTLSSDGTIGIVGAWRQDTGSGYVDVLDGSDWSSPSVLTTFDPTTEATNFGQHLALGDSGSVGVVGAQAATVDSKDDAGRVYVYESGGDWSTTSSATTTLTASTPTTDELLGREVTVDDAATTILAGAPTKSDPGEVYVFDGSGGWSGVSNETATLVPSDSASDDQFGISVAIDGTDDLAVVGAENATNQNDVQTGAVYVFDGADGWSNATEVAKLTPSDGTGSANFGANVALDGDGTTLIVGAPDEEDASGTQTGAAYVFDGSNGWSNAIETDKLVPSAATSGDEAGQGVAIADSDPTAFVGVPKLDGKGAAYPYYRS